MKHCFLSLSIAVLSCFILSSCGQYGSLYLPGSKPGNHHSETVTIDTTSNERSL